MLDARRLVILREFAIRGTIAAVAATMRLSPSAVSQQLTILERETGMELLRRAGRRLQLTPQAEILVAAASELVVVLERAEAELLASQTSVRGSLRVAVFQSAALAIMPAALRAMAIDHPEVRIEMVQQEPEQALHDTWARDFDMVIAEEYPSHSTAWLPGLDRRMLTTDPIRLALPPADVSPAEVHDLADARLMPWVMEPRGTASRHFAEQLCRTHGFEPDVRFETADLQTQIRLVESGNAVALMPDLVWTGRSTVCRLATLPGEPRRTIFTAQRAASDRSPVSRTFRAELERAARALA